MSGNDGHLSVLRGGCLFRSLHSLSVQEQVEVRLWRRSSVEYEAGPGGSKDGGCQGVLGGDPKDGPPTVRPCELH